VRGFIIPVILPKCSKGTSYESSTQKHALVPLAYIGDEQMLLLREADRYLIQRYQVNEHKLGNPYKWTNVITHSDWEKAIELAELVWEAQDPSDPNVELFSDTRNEGWSVRILQKDLMYFDFQCNPYDRCMEYLRIGGRDRQCYTGEQDAGKWEHCDPPENPGEAYSFRYIAWQKSNQNYVQRYREPAWVGHTHVTLSENSQIIDPSWADRLFTYPPQPPPTRSMHDIWILEAADHLKEARANVA